MAARAIWKGYLSCADLTVPVKLYSAALDRTVHFHLLHDQDLTRVRQRMIDPRTGEEVPSESIRRGVALGPDSFVLLDEDELAGFEPQDSREVRLERFLPEENLDPRWYERPYHLGPDGEQDAYFALAQALARKGALGFARWVMRKRDYAGALLSRAGHLMLVTLRRTGELLPVHELQPPEGRAVEAKELSMAEQLVAALEEGFDPTAYRDEYRERVLALIESKRRGAQLELPDWEPPSEARSSLGDQLEASLAGLGAGRGRR